eukprot:scaffold80443_cov36-Prasinocladus_malaysianus.AAC.1
MLGQCGCHREASKQQHDGLAKDLRKHPTHSLRRLHASPIAIKQGPHDHHSQRNGHRRHIQRHGLGAPEDGSAKQDSQTAPPGRANV